VSTRHAWKNGMPFTSVILARMLSTGHAELGKRVKRSTEEAHCLDDHQFIAP
jgi:hypothetical protein